MPNTSLRIVCISRRAVTVAIGRIFFHQRARCQNCRLVQFFNRHAVIQILDRFMQDGTRIDVFFQSDAGCADQVAYLIHIQRTALAVFDHMQLIGFRDRLGALLLRALFHALGAIQHIGAGNVVLAGTHQRQFNLVLDIFNMERAAGRLATHQRVDDVGG